MNPTPSANRRFALSNRVKYAALGIFLMCRATPVASHHGPAGQDPTICPEAVRHPVARRLRDHRKLRPAERTTRELRPATRSHFSNASCLSLGDTVDSNGGTSAGTGEAA